MILTNSEKTKILSNPSLYSPEILKMNKMDYLLESATMPSIEDLKYKYENKLIETIKDRNDNYGGEIINIFLDADPSNNRKYVEWLINSYLRGGIRRLEDLKSRAKPAIEDLNILIRKKLLRKPENSWENEADINNYFGLMSGEVKGRVKMGLEDVIESYKEVLNEIKGVKKQKLEGQEEGELVFENDLVRVIHPKTEAAACYYGQGTKWCTAADKDNMFKQYSSKGDIYIILPKNPSYPGEKYQYHHESEQYMNEKDHPVDPKNLFKRFHMEQEIPKIKTYIFSMKELEDAPDYLENIIIEFRNSIESMKDLNLGRFKNLKELSMNQMGLKKIENLPNSLITLYLDNNKITKIENLPSSLREFSLGNNQITKIENLPSSLTTLYLSTNNITKIENLPESLTHLDLSSNKIEKIENLPDSLIELSLDSNKIEKIENLPDSLIELSLSNNKIEKIETQSLPNSLKFLNLNYNKIEKIENLPSSLTTLHLYNNKIRKIEPNSLPKFLRKVTLGKNMINRTVVPEEYKDIVDI